MKETNEKIVAKYGHGVMGYQVELSMADLNRLMVLGIAIEREHTSEHDFQEQQPATYAMFNFVRKLVDNTVGITDCDDFDLFK